jgi:hypothetical protein
MRNTCVFFVAILFIWGCNSNNSAVSQRADLQDSVKYSSFVMNVLMNSINYLVPDYGKEAQLIFADNYYYGYKASKVMRKYLKKDTVNGFTGYREIKDTELNLTFRVHRWTCGCEVSLPNTILYVSNQKNFEYGFVLTDECKILTNDTTSVNLHPTGPPTLQFQLNFIMNALKMNSVQSTKYVQHFFAIVVDSLLYLKRLSAKDADELQKEKEKYRQENTQQPDCSVCTQTVDAQMDKMINEIKSRNDAILYCRSTTKYYPGFWRFEFIVKEGRMFINAAFNKCICGKLHV